MHIYHKTGTFIFLVFAFAFACKPQKNITKAPEQIKEVIQMVEYNDAWKKVDSLEQQGLVRSALELVLQIKATAFSKSEAEEIVKSILYENKFRTNIEEESQENAISRLEKELSASPEPAKSVLHSMIAELYTNYLQQHMYQMRGRTETPGEAPEDVRLWSVGHFVDTIASHYFASVSNPSIQQVKVEGLDELLTKSLGSDLQRPTLYDILAHRAIDYFMNERAFLTEPVYRYVLTDLAAFGSVDAFIQTDFGGQENEANTLQTLRLFQDVLSFHKTKRNDEALLDANLKRLKFVHDRIVHSEKRDAYLGALSELSKLYRNQPASTEVEFRRAELYYQLGMEYSANRDTTNQWALKTAHEIANAAIKQFPDAYGSQFCKRLINQIEVRNYKVDIEQVVLPGEELLGQISYRNMDRVWYKIIRVNSDQFRGFNRMRNELIIETINRLPSVYEGELSLELNGDFQNHSTEFGLQNPGYGMYILVTSTAEGFTSEKVAMQDFHISELAYFELNEKGQSGNFVVTNRKSGAPIAGVNANFYESHYRPGRREYELRKTGSSTSDLKGFLSAGKKKNSSGRSFLVELIRQNDTLFLDEYFSNHLQQGYRQRIENTHFFTDRSIYRPGQTIYFKGYLIQKDENGMPSIEPNRSITVQLYDVNQQEKGSLSLTSNDFGTFQGSFQVPSGGLTGQMHIRCDYGNSRSYFSVEEYKRPKFEVKVLPVEEQIKLGDAVIVTGEAQNYAGTPVDGANVRYRVERVRFMPYWRYGFGRFYRPGNQKKMEITYGVTQTGTDGKFEVSFDALPEAARANEEDLYYTFNIYADVIDISGETRSGEMSIRVGQKSYFVDVSMKELTPKENLSSIKLKAENLSGKDAQVNAKYTVSKLAIPQKSFRDRYWEMPDLLMISETDFTKRFPEYLYPGNEEMKDWDVLKSYPTTPFQVDGADTLDLSRLNLSSGAYAIEFIFTNDRGEELKLNRYTIVYSIQERDIPAYVKYVEDINKLAFEPGEEIKYQVGSGMPNMPHLLRFVDQRNQPLKKDWLHAQPIDETTVVVKESDRGGMKIGHSFILNNRFYAYDRNITIPWSNKRLDITYGTFRDKLLPGQEEEWIIKVSGPDKDKVSAEMLASMYDASLDAFKPHQWSMSLFPNYFSYTAPRPAGFSISGIRFLSNERRSDYVRVEPRRYRQLNWFGYSPYGQVFYAMDEVRISGARRKSRAMEETEMAPQAAPMEAGAVMEEDNLAFDKGGKEITPDADAQVSESSPSIDQPAKIRTDLEETAFFFPELKTNEAGDVLIKFKMKEALTRWKFLGLAHTKDLKIGLTENEVVTQKDLMVFPNSPRFFRQGDQIFYAAKVNNVSKEDLSGTVKLDLLDFMDRSSLNDDFMMTQQSFDFTIPAGSSEAFAWEVNVPNDRFNPVLYRVVAEAGNFTDGEEALIPVMSNRMLVTESLPMPVKSNETKDFVFNSLKNNISSNTLKNHQYTLEFTSNPAWYAVQALPYLMEYPHECSEQIFSRLYANTLAKYVANQYPAIATVFRRWQATDSDALLSNLSKNKELKSALLEETPWVLDALSEEQQKKNIALLFDLNKMADERDRAVSQLSNLQMSNGGFAWFRGGRDNWYITQYIVEGFGHLDKLNALNRASDNRIQQISERAINYTDARAIETYRELKRLVAEGKAKWEDDHLNNIMSHYLYTRSFFAEVQRSPELTEVMNYYLGQAKTYWNKKSLFTQGLLTLAMNRLGDVQTAQNIVKSLREKSIIDDELGRYWKSERGYYWHQLPIERHALMIELFDEMTDDQAFVDELRVWLLKNKQTNRWETTKSTASAVYALLIQKDNWLQSDDLVGVSIGNKEVRFAAYEAEPGTGYIKKKWDGKEVNAGMANVQVVNPNNHIAWGAVYWQYFEDLDKITFFEETPVKINKELYVESASDRGPKAISIEEANGLAPGDKILVRLIVESDREMEFVHLKDMRASGLEPIDVISQYHWRGGLGYYQSTKDLATHFFFDRLPRGKFVIEYDLRVAHRGDFSNGISTLQSMYAPEFTAHSEGERLKIEN